MSAADRDDERIEWSARVIVECADRAGIGILITGVYPRVRHLYANRAAAAIVGRTPEEMLEIDPLAGFDGEERARIEAMAQNLAQTGYSVPNLETTFTRPDGNVVTVQVSSITAIVDGHPAAVVVMLDTTQRREAEQSLNWSEDRFRRVIETVPEAIYITDGLTLEYANPAFFSTFGLAGGESIAGVSILDFVHPDDERAFVQQSCTVSERSAPVGEYRMLTRDGRTRTIEVSAIAIEYEGRPRVLSFGRDVTERKQSEAQLIQADRLAALGTLAGGMAHAINNPLAYVLLNLEHLARRLPELSGRRDYIAEARVRLAEAKDGADRVAGVVRQMRHFSRMLRGDDSGPVDVRAALQAALDLVANEIRHRGQLSTHLREVPRVFGSEGQIEQALLTLLIFAARSLPEETPGEGRLEIETSTDEQRHAIVTVRCIGVSMSAAARTRIFEPFGGGGEEAGLGLAMCADIVSAMNGTIHVSGDAGRTVFTLVLPATEEDVPVAEKSVRPRELARAVTSAAPARVLVIDDDPGVVSALRVLLQEHHDVTSVASAREGLRKLLESDEYDVVFCDLMMPDMSGEDLYDALKLNKSGAEQRLVFMTGAAFTPEVERFLSSVPNARVEKPFSVEYVDEVLRRVVGQKPQAEASER